MTFPAARAPQLAGRKGSALRGRASGGGAGFSRWRSAFDIEIGSLEESVFLLINRDVRRQAPLRGPIPKAPGFAGGYLLTHSQTIDLFIEQSCYDRDLPAFVGGKGTADEQRAALRAAYLAMNGTAPAP